MPIGIELQSPQGAVIESLTEFDDVRHTTLPYHDDATFQLLNKIDCAHMTRLAPVSPLPYMFARRQTRLRLHGGGRSAP